MDNSLEIDYGEPPVLVGLSNPINGYWRYGEAVFPIRKDETLTDGYMWVWLKDGNVTKVTIDNPEASTTLKKGDSIVSNVTIWRS